MKGRGEAGKKGMWEGEGTEGKRKERERRDILNISNLQRMASEDS